MGVKGINPTTKSPKDIEVKRGKRIGKKREEGESTRSKNLAINKTRERYGGANMKREKQRKEWGLKA